MQTLVVLSILLVDVSHKFRVYLNFGLVCIMWFVDSAEVMCMCSENKAVYITDENPFERINAYCKILFLQLVVLLQ